MTLPSQDLYYKTKDRVSIRILTIQDEVAEHLERVSVVHPHLVNVIDRVVVAAAQMHIDRKYILIAIHVVDHH